VSSRRESRRSTFPSRGGYLLGDPFAVIGMGYLDQVVQRRLDLARLQAEETKHVV